MLQESISSSEVYLQTLKLSLMHNMCDVQKISNNIKAFLAGALHEHLKDKKRFCDELIFEFKQLADFIGKSNINLSLLQTSDFSKNKNFIFTQRNEK